MNTTQIVHFTTDIEQSDFNYDWKNNTRAL